MIVALLLSPALAQQGQGALSGFAFEAGTGAPIAGAHVTVDGQTVTSDASGAFQLSLPQGVWTVELRAEGYQGGALSDVAVGAGEVTEVLVTFSPDAIPTALVEAPELSDAPEVDVDAAPGTLEGQVLDPAGEPVAEARVYVRGQDAQATTDADGRFALELPSGVHELSVLRNGYATGSVREVEVPAGEQASVQITLEPAKLALDSFVISAPYVEGSVASLLDERRESSAVADVLGAEEMSRSGAGDAAAALSRVTGLTVVGGKYVYVRGMGDRYSSSLLNGGMLPSPEPERRVVPLDLFPASILESVVIQKTWSPDMPAEFGGGVVQLRTIRPPSELVAEVSLSGGYRHRTTLQDGLDYPGGPTDWLGIDGGFRDLPDAVAEASASSPLEEGDLFSDRGYTPEELEALGEAMPNVWNTETRGVPPDLGVGMSLGSGLQRGRVRAGLLGALTYGNEWQTLHFDRTYYDVGAGGALQRQNQYTFDQTTNDIQLGAFVTGGVEVGEEHSVRYVGMLNRSTDDTGRIYQGYNGDVGQDIRITRLRWVERRMLYHQLLGEHDLQRLKLGWRGILGGAGRSEPDRREYRFDNEPGTDRWLLSDRPEGNQRFFSDSAEQFRELGADLTLRLRPDEGDPGGIVKAGAVAIERKRGVDTRRFKYFHKGPNSRDQDILAQDMASIFVPENIGPEGFQFEEFTRQTDNYTAGQQIQAAYLMTELPITPWLRAMAGARLEHSRQQVETFELFNPDQTPVGSALEKTDVLPGATVTLAPVDEVQLRVGVARTVSRPEFRELSPATFNDVTGGRQTFGNPDLDRTRIDHLDVRLEWFPAAGEVVSISGFVKKLTDPIETIVIASAQQSVTWENAEAANNMGVELEVRKSLPLSFFSAGNLALIRSRIVLGEDAGGIQTSAERALQGQSPYVLNLQVGWDHPDRGDQLTVLYNIIGKRITEVGALGTPDAFELPVHMLDVVARKDLGKGFSLSLKGSNLLDATAVTTQGTETIDEIRKGWRIGLGIRWSPDR